MKKLAILTFIAAFTLGFNPNNSFAQKFSSPSLSGSLTGSTSIFYDAINETLVMRLYMPTGQEQVGISILDDLGNKVYMESVLVHARGVLVEIPTIGYAKGLYRVQVSGPSFNIEKRFRIE